LSGGLLRRCTNSPLLINFLQTFKQMICHNATGSWIPPSKLKE
jgi:hypothetical protein